MFCLAASLEAQVLWSEDFQSYTDNSGYTGPGTTASGDYPASVSKWTIDVSSATLADDADWFMVNEISTGVNVFETKDTDGECIWTSESIAITGYIVSVQISLSESGSLEDDEYIKTYYKLDGGAEVLFETNGSVLNDFTAVTCSQTALTGSTLQIVVKTSSNHKNELLRFDDIVVSAKREDPASFTASSASASTISFAATANSASDSVMVASNTVNTFGTPTGSYTIGDALSGGGTVHFIGSVADITNHTGLTAGETYYYKVWSYSNSDYYSDGITSSAVPVCSSPNEISSLVSSSSHSTIDLSWVNGLCADEILVVLKSGAAVTNSPSGDGTAYTANSEFGSGTDLGSSEYVTYKGLGTSVSITGLTNETTYHFSVFSRVGENWSTGVVGSETPEQQKLIITEVAEPSGASSGACFLEVKNVSNTTLDFDTDTYYISMQNNGGATWDEFQLSGTLCAGCVRTYANNSSTFLSKYGHSPDFTNSAISGTGDDAYCIYFGGDHATGDIVDIYGVIDEDGTGQSWEYRNSRAVRNSDVETGLGIWDVSEWTISAATVSDMTPDAMEDEFRYIGAAWRPGAVAPNGMSTTKKVTVQSGTATLSDDVDCSNLETYSDAELVISAGKGVTVNNDITVNGTISIESDATTNGSLIVSGGAMGTVTYTMYITGGASSPWHLITCPVSSQSINDFVTDANNSIQVSGNNNYGVGQYNTSTDVWNYFHNGSGFSPNIAASTAGDFVEGQGYAILRSADGTVTFTGTVNVTDQAKALSASKWNLVGNPYSSFVNVNSAAHSSDNIISASGAAVDDLYEAIYIWNATTSQYDIVNQASAATYLSPGQGFFVKADSDGGDYNFTEAMQSHQAGDWFERSTTVNTSLVLTADFPSTMSSTEIKYIEGTTIGLDLGYDAGRFTGGNNDFYVCSKLVDDSIDSLDVGLQCLPLLTNEQTYAVPIEVKAVEECEVTFTLAATELPENTVVYIEDVQMESFTRLDIETTSYTALIDEFTYNSSRFFLHTQSPEVGMKELLSTIAVYVRNGSELHIEGAVFESASLTLYDELGRIVFVRTLGQNETKIDLPLLNRGAYIVSIKSGFGIITKKIIL